MSYEGYTEWLCENGHYSCSGCYEKEPAACSFCGGSMTWRHGVDVTNGIDEQYPYSYPAHKEIISFDDDYRVDHHGNRYAMKVDRYKPLDHWVKVV